MCLPLQSVLGRFRYIVIANDSTEASRFQPIESAASHEEG